MFEMRSAIKIEGRQDAPLFPLPQSSERSSNRAIENPHQSIKQMASAIATLGDVPWHVICSCMSPLERASFAAARLGGSVKWKKSLAVSYAGEGNAPALWWALERLKAQCGAHIPAWKNFVWKSLLAKVCVAACKGGSVECMRMGLYLMKRKLSGFSGRGKLLLKLARHAVSSEQPGCLEYLFLHGCPADVSITKEAVICGSLGSLLLIALHGRFIITGRVFDDHFRDSQLFLELLDAVVDAGIVSLEMRVVR